MYVYLGVYSRCNDTPLHRGLSNLELNRKTRAALYVVVASIPSLGSIQ